MASWGLAFLYFISFIPVNLHYRNNAKHTPILKRKKLTYKKKNPKRSVQPTFIYKVNKLVKKLAGMSAKKPAKSKARILLPVLKKC